MNLIIFFIIIIYYNYKSLTLLLLTILLLKYKYLVDFSKLINIKLYIVYINMIFL